jgi:poly(beta-D-mannuronate) lyase
LVKLTLEPGDEIVWADGNYSDQRIDFIARGTSDTPITLRAETPGGVRLTGDSQMNLAGQDLVVSGFFFDGGEGTTGVVEFRESGASTLDRMAQRVTLRDCAFRGLLTEGDNKSRWIILYGEENTVERCSFLDKDSTGACILIELHYQGDNGARHVIRDNFFARFSRKDGRENDGDSEAIRIGSSSQQAIDARVSVEGNYFLETDGENEIITNKSRNNHYSGNTFRRCRGGLVMRHGSGAIVEGNFFLGGGVPDSGGVRISDQGHVIRNNYFAGLRGTLWNAGLVWMGGNAASGGTSSGYQYVENVTVAFNTFYDVAESMRLNNEKGNRSPANCVMANNLVYSTSGPLIVGVGDLSLNGMTFAGNLMAGAEVGYTSAGILTDDPQMEAVNGLFQPSPTGPAADAANTTAGITPTEDLFGFTRDAKPDIGAIEVAGASGSASRRPRVDADVGEKVGASFLDVAGEPKETEEITAWAGFPVAAQFGETLRVETGAWLGSLWIEGPWVYLTKLQHWAYLPETRVAATGAWYYVPRI